MGNYLINQIKSNQQIFKNLTWLTLLQFANFLIPLLLIPYIVRIVGVELFGKVTYAQNIITYFIVFVNFGFEYSATQEIAIHKSNLERVRAIFFSVLRFKTLLLIVSFFVLLVLAFTFDEVVEDRLLYFYAYLILIGHVLFPNWFLQGIEKMSQITIFIFIVKLLGALLIVLFVRQANDYRLFLLFLSLSFIFVGGVSLGYVIRSFNIHYTSKKDLFVIEKGLPIFLNNFFALVYSVVGFTILGILVSDYEKGVYSGAYKIISAGLMVVTVPITMALFPTISRKFNESFELGFIFYKKAFIWSSVFGLLVSVSIFFLSKYIVLILLGREFQESIIVLRVLSAIPFLVIVASMLTVQGMYALQLQKYAPYVGATICLVSLLLNYWIISIAGIVGAAWSYVIVEILEIILVASILVYHFKKKRQLL